MDSSHTNPIDTNGSDQEDQEYNPSAEALIDDIDDERTLDEEEALEEMNADDEVDDLRKDAEMPLDELLAYYNNLSSAVSMESSDSVIHQQGTVSSINENYHHLESNLDSIQNLPSNHNDDLNKSTLRDTISEADLESTCNKQSDQSDPLPQCSLLPTPTTCIAFRFDEIEQKTSVDTYTDETFKPSPAIDPTTRLHEDSLNPLLAYELDDSDDDEDYSCSDEDVDTQDWRKSIQVGPEYQATIPEGLSEYDDAPAYENEDRLMWCCKDMTIEQTQDFLIKAAAISKKCSNTLRTMPTITEDSVRCHQLDYFPNPQESPMIADSVSESQPMQIDDLYMEQSRKQQRANRHDFFLQQQACDQRDKNENDDFFNSQNLPSRVTSETHVPSTHDNQTELSKISDRESEGRKNEAASIKQHYIQEEEQLLYLLLQCNHNTEEALRRRRLNPYKYYIYEPMSSWSQDECLGFENGLRSYGKDFRLINQNKVQTRSHSELVAFYYIWKKSERHDIYINQYKIDRKRCFAHPGTADYMDKFIEENEAILASPQVSTTDTFDLQSSHTLNATQEAHRPGAMMTSHNFPIFQQNNDNSANIVSNTTT